MIGQQLVTHLQPLTRQILAGGGEVAKAEGSLRYTASEGLYRLSGGNPQTNLLTTVVQNVQAKINTARVQAILSMRL